MFFAWPRCLVSTFGGGLFRHRTTPYKSSYIVSNRTMTVQKMLTKLQALITILILLCLPTMSVNIQNVAVRQSGITIRFGQHHKKAFAFLTRMLNNNYSYRLTGAEYDSLFVDPANKTDLKDDAMAILDKLFANYVKGISVHSASGNNSAEVKHMKKAWIGIPRHHHRDQKA